MLSAGRLALLKDFLSKVPEEDTLSEKSVDRYTGEVIDPNSKNHELGFRKEVSPQPVQDTVQAVTRHAMGPSPSLS